MLFDDTIISVEAGCFLIGGLECVSVCVRERMYVCGFESNTSLL